MSNQLAEEIEAAIDNLIEACVAYGRNDSGEGEDTIDHQRTVACQADLRAAIRAALPATRAALDVETLAARAALTDAERAVFPLNVQPDARSRVRLAHIESGEGALAGQGTAVVSVPSKYERLAWFMVCAANEALGRTIPAANAPDVEAMKARFTAALSSLIVSIKKHVPTVLVAAILADAKDVHATPAPKLDEKCPACGGAGVVDSGAPRPDGGWYDKPCPYCPQAKPDATGVEQARAAFYEAAARCFAIEYDCPVTEDGPSMDWHNEHDAASREAGQALRKWREAERAARDGSK